MKDLLEAILTVIVVLAVSVLIYVVVLLIAYPALMALMGGE